MIIFLYTSCCDLYTASTLAGLLVRIGLKLDTVIDQQAEMMTMLRSLTGESASNDDSDDILNRKITTIEEVQELDKMLESPDARKKMVQMYYFHCSISVVMHSLPHSFFCSFVRLCCTNFYFLQFAFLHLFGFDSVSGWHWFIIHSPYKYTVQAENAAEWLAGS